MRHFVLDNDALEHLVSRPDYGSLKSKVLESLERNVNRIYVTEINFWELLKGADEQNFERLRNLLREFYELSGNGHMLLRPERHLKQSQGWLDEEVYVQECRQFAEQARRMANSSSFEEFDRLFGGTPKEIDRLNREMLEFYLEGDKEIRKKTASVTRSQAAKGLSSEVGFAFFKMFLPALARRFRLTKELEGKSASAVASSLPSLLLFSEIFRAKLKKKLADGAISRSGDYFDVEKIVYLDLCDYLITDDRRLRTLFKAADSCGLPGRAISLDKFLLHIEHPFLLNQLTSCNAEVRRI